VNQPREFTAPRPSGLARDRFPLLRRRLPGGGLVYLDSAATAQKPVEVIEAEARYYRTNNANVHRGMHTLAAEATAAYEGCRERVADLVGVPTEDVVITRGATSALNLVARGLAHDLRPGDEILLTEMEHHANLVPWIMVARERELSLRHIPVTDQGELDLETLPGLIGPRTRVVGLTHVSNVLGTINPVREIAEAARAAGALVVVDAAQSVGQMPVSLDALGADFLAFSAHKAYGPMGLGFLAARSGNLSRLQPVEGGGEMIETVELDRATWTGIPHRFEAGTPNVAAAAAFPAALDLLAEIGLDTIRLHAHEIVSYAWNRLSALGGLQLFGPVDPQRRAGLISFHDPLVHPHDMATLLDQRGVAVRAGHHCAQPLHRRLGVVATTRLSLGMYSDHDDIDALIEAVSFARSVFAR